MKLMTTHLQREINKLKQHLLALSAEVEGSIDKAYRALMKTDVDRALQVIKDENVIDEHEVEIEEECLKIMALHQPVAGDLRIVVGLLKMNNDLERMGDLAQSIARYVVKMAQSGAVEIPLRFEKIFDETRKMVRNSLDALVNGDVELARNVCENDDIVDQLNVEIIDEIMERIQENPNKIRSLILLVSVSRNIERIADNATNIAEDVIYMNRGEIVRHHGTDDSN